MTTFLDNDSLHIGKLIAFHWNSHRNCFSIIEMRSAKTIGKLIGYAETILVENSYFLFQESKRNYTLETEKKERHSFIVGNFLSFSSDSSDFKKAYYNPLKISTFVDAKDFFNEGKITNLPSNCLIFASSFFKEEENKQKPDIFYK